MLVLSRTSLSNPPLSSIPFLFWLVEVCWSTYWWLINTIKYIIYIIFALIHSTPQTMEWCPHKRSAPATTFLQHSIYQWCQLFVKCWFASPNGSHLRKETGISLLFLVCSILAPKTREPATTRAHQIPRACYRPIGSSGTKIWGHGGCCHGNRGR